MLSARFQNKVAIRPIQAKEVHAHHQVYLVNMNKTRTSFEGKEYRYILSVCDVFSWFVWLKPLIGKSSAEIANHLQNIYREHGTPKIIQHDQRKEFKGSVKKLLQRMNVKIIQSSPYHAQSQGKIERLHRQFRKKINYDLFSMKRTGVNWVKQLDKYASILNDESKEELAWRSPFEIYFGRQKNKLSTELSSFTGIFRDHTSKKQLDTSEKYQMLSARFQNKVAIRPIQAKEVHAHHQVDLVNMNKMRTSFEGKEYRYILSVCDVFSRFVWLKALIGKSSAEIANHLQKIYREHGTPRIIQHDQGKEFKGSVKKLLQRMNVKIIQSSPCHAQSQGKIERLHRQFRKKINYDLFSMKRTGVNWVKQLDKYASILNDESKEELAWRSPFEIYFGRQKNKLSTELSSRASSLHKRTYLYLYEWWDKYSEA